jgi:hypothetical protein
VPEQPPNDGVIVIVAVTGLVPVFVPVKAVISPLPDPLSPIVVLSFVHVKTVPLTPPVKVMGVVDGTPSQTVCPTGIATAFGVGLTVIVAVIGVPEQPLATGVTVIVAVTGEVPALIAANDRMSPEPEAPRPIEVVLLVQL